MEESVVNTEVQEQVENPAAPQTEEAQPQTAPEVQEEAQPKPEEKSETAAEKAAEETAPLTADERLKKRYPDANPQNPEEWEKLRSQLLDDYEATEKSHAEWEQEVNDLLLSDDQMALIANEMLVNHTPLRVAIAKVFDPEDLKPKEGEEDYEEYEKAYKERLEHNKAMMNRQKEIDANAEKSFENIDKFCQDKGYDDKTKDGIVDFINELFDAIVMKNITPELLAKIDKARTFDSAVRDAAIQGEVKGRNANIEAQRVKEMEKEEGDGIPAPRATGGSPLQPKQEAPRHSLDSFMSGIGENKWMNNR